jgi:nucleoid-associated protein YgaU
MLNKDQYNQEEYNDYYRQETEGAEIKGSYKKEGKGKTIIVLSTLLLLGVAGYFGFTQLQTSSNIETNEKEIKIDKEEAVSINESSETKNKEVKEIKEEIEKTEPKIVNEVSQVEKKEIETPKNQKEEKVSLDTEKNDETIESNLATAVEKSVTASQKMSPEEIAKVVQLVMSQMNQKDSNENNNEETVSNDAPKTETVTNDSDLLNALSESMVDTITENSKTDYTTVKETQNIEVKEKKKAVDTYNKVTIQTTSGSDELSKLSEEISNVIQETEDNPTIHNTSSYTQSITKEVAERSNAMRIIIVKKGDTLGKIARRAYGNVMDYKKIYSANPDLINRPDRIYIGQKLRIPE